MVSFSTLAVSLPKLVSISSLLVAIFSCSPSFGTVHENIVTDKTFKKTIAQSMIENGKQSSISLVIQIDVKPCTEMSGAVKEKRISIRYNNQNFKGCAGADNH